MIPYRQFANREPVESSLRLEVQELALQAEGSIA